MRRGKHLRAQPRKKKLEAMRRVEHLRAQPPEHQLEAMWRVEYLRAQQPKNTANCTRTLFLFLPSHLGVAKGTMFINHEGLFKSVNTSITNGI